jgi:uncharacterized protein (DUF2267 family)
LLLKRYGGGIDYVLSLTADEGFKLIDKALENQLEESLFDLWKSGYNQKIPYREFRNRVGEPQGVVTNESSEEIIKDVISMFDKFF